jgi:hypothetical protein
MSRIILNVGGTLFHTTEQTLTKYECFFTGLFRMNPVNEKNSDVILNANMNVNLNNKEDYTSTLSNKPPEYFIDNSPDHFHLVLNWLRTNKYPKTLKEIDYFIDECEFYLIPINFQEVNKIKQRIFAESGHHYIKQFKKLNEGQTHTIVLPLTSQGIFPLTEQNFFENTDYTKKEMNYMYPTNIKNNIGCYTMTHSIIRLGCFGFRACINSINYSYYFIYYKPINDKLNTEEKLILLCSNSNIKIYVYKNFDQYWINFY